MAKYNINNEDYSEDVTQIENTDQAKADTLLNPFFSRLLNNIATVKKWLDDKMHLSTGHKHTGTDGDAPKLTKESLADNAVETAALKDGQVTNAKMDNMAPGTIKGRTGGAGVTAGAPQDLSASQARTAMGLGTVATMNVPGAAAGTAGANEVVRGDDPRLTDNRTPADNSVTENKIGVGAVTENKIGASAVSAVKLAADSVETLKIKNSAVTSDKLADKAVTEGKLGDNAATDDKIGNRTISDFTAPSTDTAKPATLFGFLAYMIKSITGKTTWRTVPAVSLETLSGRIQNKLTVSATAPTSPSVDDLWVDKS